MHPLHTRATVISAKVCQVEWFAGKNKCGLLNVQLDFDHKKHETALIGELLAIQHLIFDKNIFSMTKVVSPNYVQLFVSSLQILNIHSNPNGLSSQVYHASSFLRNRFKGVSLELFIDENKFEFINRSIVDIFPVEDPLIKHFTHIYLDAPALGSIMVNTHAIDQYIKHHESTGNPLKHPIDSLVSRMMNPELLKMDIPEHVLRHKLFEYQNNENIEVWGHPNATLKFLVVTDDNVRTLRTVFRKGFRLERTDV
ncbi:hypothetical protein F0267_00725 [Vibrio coralliilyticus]|uniref:Uncharacterized protein n=2 Tax=Vibrio TaxID=662 RepID=A0AAN0SHE8_9VIBR|nr:MULTISPECIES: hypothetical protein [Vibrio]AIW22649.1 hypothetical protein IX92_26685 [Vibrio coralliilyticus]MCZ2798858.1 hypothetical protein [Vibrio alginolyticus]NOH36744.1 hypothetical protein [Vibrio coralliilyticus]PAW02266.1 hypothetical protein CKJ79_16530 [Vibrio coralliilyticus]POB46984.1 hypothetical protein CRN52_12975 [Vibrio vulnificus]